MTEKVAAIVGSGTVPYVRGILPELQRGIEDDGEGIRTGIQMMVGNPEDLLAVDAFAASGVTVGTTAIEVLSPGTNPLPRSRQVIIENIGSNEVYISHKDVFTTLDAFELSEGVAGENNRVTLPVLHNVSIWAKTDTGTSTVRLLIF
jgi:hypothetical protein